MTVRPGATALLNDWQSMSRLRRSLFLAEAAIKSGDLAALAEADRQARVEIRSIRTHLAAIDADLARLHPTADRPPATGGRADALLADLAATIDRPDIDEDR